MNVKVSCDFDSVGFRKRLRQMIEEQYGTATAFAEACGIQLSTIYRVLNVDSVPTVPVLLQMCDKLGCTMEFLLGICLESSDSREAFETALENIYAFQSDWSRTQILYLVFAAMGMLSPREQEKLRVFLKLDGKENSASPNTAKP